MQNNQATPMENKEDTFTGKKTTKDDSDGKKRKGKKKVIEEEKGIAIDGENFPQALADWINYSSNKEAMKNSEAKEAAKLQAKKHLEHKGWHFWYRAKGENRQELVYTSPKGVNCYTLKNACKVCIEEGDAEPVGVGSDNAGLNWTSKASDLNGASLVSPASKEPVGVGGDNACSNGIQVQFKPSVLEGLSFSNSESKKRKAPESQPFRPLWSKFCTMNQ